MYGQTNIIQFMYISFLMTNENINQDRINWMNIWTPVYIYRDNQYHPSYIYHALTTNENISLDYINWKNLWNILISGELISSSLLISHF